MLRISNMYKIRIHNSRLVATGRIVISISPIVDHSRRRKPKRSQSNAQARKYGKTRKGMNRQGAQEGSETRCASYVTEIDSTGVVYTEEKEGTKVER
jgi:hypothetical protein